MKPNVKRKSYYIKPLLMMLFGFPLLVQASQMFVLFTPLASMFSAAFSDVSLLFIAGLPGVLLGTIMWWHWAKKVDEGLLPKSLLMRFLPQVIVFCSCLLFWLIIFVLAQMSYASEFWWLLMLDFPYCVSTFLLIFFAHPDIFIYIQLVQFIISILVPFMVFAYRKVAFRADRRLIIVGGVIVSICAAIMLGLWQRSQRFLDFETASSGESVGGEVDLFAYAPFKQTSNLPEVRNPSLAITSNWPKMDGATAAYPVYAAVAQSVYKGLDSKTVEEYVTCSNTIGAYERLSNREVDVIFGAQPSGSQQQAAAEKGIKYEMLPLGREAFVFFVHKDNPVSNLNIEHIRDIYTKRITNWSELGGEHEAIVAFQRNANSGSQTIMESKVMNKEPMFEPLRYEQASGMGGVVDEVAEYRNGVAAIGYSFRFYVTGMKKTSNVKLLAIDGVEPTTENIRNGVYPLTIEFGAVTAGSKNEHLSELLQWMQSEQGQQLIEDCGYVGL